MVDLLIFGYDMSGITESMFNTVLVFILVDIIVGILASAKERKLSSSINFEGLIKKLGELVGVVFLTFVDVYLQTGGTVVKAGVTLLIVYEVMSIAENFNRIGVNLDFIMKYFDKEEIEQKGKGDKYE